jgi:hypothetical protein
MSSTCFRCGVQYPDWNVHHCPPVATTSTTPAPPVTQHGQDAEAAWAKLHADILTESKKARANAHRARRKNRAYWEGRDAGLVWALVEMQGYWAAARAERGRGDRG